MFGFLFGRLTAAPKRGAALFARVTDLARQPHWYLEGQVADTLDGRFAMLSTIAALVLVRLEREGERGDSAGAALTERFVEAMDSEHREIGLSDPTLGKTVRKLVGVLAQRNALWRSAVAGETDWREAARKSLYRNGGSQDALDHSTAALKMLWANLDEASIDGVEQGAFAQ